MQALIIDAHVHCGRQFADPPQAFEDYLACVADSGITGAVMFPPVMEIYDRLNPAFEDDPQWRRRRQRGNDYLLTLNSEAFRVFPYFFIWNDFAVERLSPLHKGIKWHRHQEEPHYRYEDPRCRAAIEEIRQRDIPVVLEEELGNTLQFINDLAPDLRVIIPHGGWMNGGYEELRDLGVWERPNIFTDTRGFSRKLIVDYVARYGPERVLFGSDYPFFDPKQELARLTELSLPNDVKEAILGGNVQRLLAGPRK